MAPILNTTGGVALFDVAVHLNLGDTMLWAATARLVSEFHHSAKVVCALSQYGIRETMRFPKCDVQQTVASIGDGGVVLIAPGGNWGDLWPVQKKRVQYLQAMSKLAQNSTRKFKVSLSFNENTVWIACMVWLQNQLQNVFFMRQHGLSQRVGAVSCQL